MNLVTIDYIAIIVFALALATFVLFVRKSDTYKDFAVAGKSFGATMLTASFVATLIGPGFSIGMVGRGFSTGLYFLVGAVAYGIGYWLFGYFLSPKLAQMQGTFSLGEIMEKKYNTWGKKLTGLTSFILLAGLVAIMVKVASGLLTSISGLSTLTSVVLIVALVVTYTIFGGMKTSVYTDIFQTVVFGAVLLILLFTAAAGSAIGFPEAVSSGVSLGVSKLASMPALAIVGFIFSLMFGEVFLPPVIGRALSSKSAADSRKAFSLTGLLVPIVLGGFLLMGIFASGGLVEASTANDEVIMSLASGQFGTGMLGLFVAALLSIVSSSMDSLLQSGAVAITSDVIGFGKEDNSQESLLTSRIATVILGIVGGGLALLIPDLISTLLIIYSLWVPIVMIPLLYAVFSTGVAPLAGILAMLSGGIGSYVWEYLLSDPAGLPGVIFGTLLSLAVIEVVSRFSYKNRNPRTT